MEKKKYKEEELVITDNTKIIPVEVSNEMKTSFIAYAMAVNISRAIPDVRDGLKPVHRRIMYTMGEMGLTNDKAFRKCARIVGDVMGKYHPHGDSSIYEALVRLAQNFSINCPLVDGHGNFGSIDGDGAAAMRYTEARMTKISNELLKDINKETVDFKPNYDGTENEPVVLPSKFPNLLVNGADGIAVGMATNIPPHNLGEVIDGVLALLENPDITIDELIKIIPAPDFPTKGLIMGTQGCVQAYKTGRGNIVVRARTEIEEYDNGKSRIIVTEIPYQVNKAKLITDIAELVKNKKVEGIYDIRDESDRNIRVIIDIKKDYNPHIILNYLFKHTQLQNSDGMIMLALADGKPKCLNLKEILAHYVKHQKEVITRRTRYDLKKAEDRAHILQGLIIALADIDAVIDLIKKSKDRQDAILNLTTKYDLDEIQAINILETRLQRLTSMEVEKIKTELRELEISIANFKEILADENKVVKIIEQELTEVKEKYAEKRKSEICLDYGDINIEDLIAKEDVVISLTNLGYVKRIPVAEYKAQRRGGIGVNAHKTKEEDFVTDMFVASTHQNILCFTTKGKVYSIKAYMIPEATKQAKGRAIINMLNLEPEERVTTVLPVPEERDGNLLLVTQMGLVKKTSIREFDSIRVNGKIAITLNDDDKLIGVQLTSGNDDILIASSEGKCIRFNESKVRASGRTSMGVRAMKFSENEHLVEAIVCKKDSYILTISELGIGKRSDINEYRETNRGGKGILAGKFDEETGKLIAIKQIEENQDVIIITNNGTMIRTPINDIRLISRNSKGVKIMKMKKNELIVSVAVVEHQEETPLPEENFEENENIILETNNEILENQDVVVDENMTEDNVD